ncbi:MAG: chloride channel protein [Chloroflexota bacterium]|nr:chloride channel protein [Chloroflexota bacterium]
MEEQKQSTLLNLVMYPWNLMRSSDNFAGVSLAILVGTIAGFGAVLFRWMINGIQWLFFKQSAQVFDFMGDYYVIILPALGGLIVGPLIYFFAREAKGHGVPEVMAAVAVKKGRIRPRVAAIKAMASAICIGSGGSVGREGPIVQIGSSFGSSVGQWFRLPEDWTKTLVACGAAGGIAATFNAPIAGVFFAQEVILRRFITPSFLFVVISAVMANVISQAFLGSNPSFIVPEYALDSAWEIPLYALLGVAAAFVAWVFIRVLYKCEDLFDAFRFPSYLKPVLGGLLIGLIGFFYPDLFGVGYGSGYGPGGVYLETVGVDKALLGEFGIGLLLTLGFLKIVATSLTIGSGGSGGIFAPSLFMGSMFGGAFGEFIHQIFPTSTTPSGAYAMVGMGAVFAGAARAPITSIIMLFEMTRDYMIILPLMTAVVISTLVSRKLSRDSIYTTKTRRQGIDLRRMEERDVMKTVSVSQAMTRDFPSVPPQMPVADLLKMMERTGHHGFPVIDEKGHLYGVVTLSDVHAGTEKDDSDVAYLTVEDIATTSPFVAYPDQTLHQALLRFGTTNFGVPVVDRDDPTKFLGLLRRHDIIRSYIGGTGESLPPRT